MLGAVLSVETTSVAWAYSFRSLRIPGHFLPPIAGMPYDQARNTACMRCLELGFDYLFFLDSDVRPPPDAVERLLAHDKDIISGVYHRRSQPHGLPVMMINNQWVTQYPRGGLIEVELVGAGCLLISRRVIEKLPPQRAGKHWFDWRLDDPNSRLTATALSEDYTFDLHARRHGYKVYVDTTVRCLHTGLADYDEGGAKPPEVGIA